MRTASLTCGWTFGGSGDEEVRLTTDQPVTAPIGKPDGAAVRQIGDEVLTKTILDHAVALVGPMDGLPAIHGGLDFGEGHLTLQFM